jgi:Zn-dependent peptidase ImmA (M78 family)
MSAEINIEFEAPKATNLPKTAIYEIAESMARRLQPNNDLGELIEQLGGKVLAKDFWAEGSIEGGSLEVRAVSDFTVYIPMDTSKVRDRFTVAHELGHYMLHYLWPLQILKRDPFKLKASRYGSDRVEWEANWFATAFLMPEDKFRELANSGATIDEIASSLRVSKQAASFRAKALNVDVTPR